MVNTKFKLCGAHITPDPTGIEIRAVGTCIQPVTEFLTDYTVTFTATTHLVFKVFRYKRKFVFAYDRSNQSVDIPLGVRYR